MRSSVCPTLTTAAIVHGLSTDHDRRRGQRCTVLTHPVSLIHRGISVQTNRATSLGPLLIQDIYKVSYGFMWKVNAELLAFLLFHT